jgi:hypothetical protein
MEKEPVRVISKVDTTIGYMLDVMMKDHHIAPIEAYRHVVNTLGVELTSEESLEVFEFMRSIVNPQGEERC